MNLEYTKKLRKEVSETTSGSMYNLVREFQTI